MEEGNLSHSRCLRCNMMVPWHALNGGHLATNQCDKGSERKQRWMAEEDMRESLERAFQAYSEPLETVT